jgi:tetratricopeptide (TPR) repeat protein
VIDLADKIVSLIVRFAAVPNHLVVAEVERHGGIVRRGLPPRTAIVAIGRRSLAQLADGRLQTKLARADLIGALCLSENAMLRALELVPAQPAGAGALRLDELPDRTGLDAASVRVLVLYDVIQPCDGACTFRDLIAAREVARLLGEGVGLTEIVRSTDRLSRAGVDDSPLARHKLVRDEGGRLARRVGDAYADLDGQLRLSLPHADNPSVDEVFDAAEEAEQAGDLASAAELYRRCVSMDPHDPIAPFNLANVLREQGEAGPAKLFLELALAIDPEFADAWYNLALLQETAGDKRAVQTSLERAIAADPDYADPLYNLAKLHFERGGFAEASRLWQRYLTLDPDSDWSRRARSGLTLCQQSPSGRRPSDQALEHPGQGWGQTLERCSRIDFKPAPPSKP